MPSLSLAGRGPTLNQSSSWRRMVADTPCSHLRCAWHSADHRHATNARRGASYEDAIAFATPYADHGLISTRVSAALLDTLLHPAEENRRPSGSWNLPLSIFNQSLGSLTAARCSFNFVFVDSIAALMCPIHGGYGKLARRVSSHHLRLAEAEPTPCLQHGCT